MGPAAPTPPLVRSRGDMGAHIYGILTIAVLAATACQTSSDGRSTASTTTVAKKPATAVKAATVLPATFGTKLETKDGPLILVPTGMLAVAKVSRPRAEVRSGPGVQYELADKVLPLGTSVMVFDKVGVWQKVVVMKTSQTGWIHSQALTEPRSSDVPMRVDVRRLPTVLALHDVDSVQSFPALDVLAAKVPRGVMFRTLRYADNGTLVWLPETASVMWMSRKDVQ